MLIADQPDIDVDEIVAAMRKRRIAGSRSTVKTISDSVTPVGNRAGS